MRALRPGVSSAIRLSTFNRGTTHALLSAERKSELIRQFGRTERDTGSTEVQVAMLTDRIGQVTEHVKLHARDHSSRRGLLLLVSQRRALLGYLKRRNEETYRTLVDRLGIRG